MSADKPRTLVELTRAACLAADEYNASRSPADICLAIQAELGELAEEVAIDSGSSYKQADVDGIKGESIDVMLSTLDLLFKKHPDITEEEICEYAQKKLNKWLDRLANRSKGK